MYKINMTWINLRREYVTFRANTLRFGLIGFLFALILSGYPPSVWADSTCTRKCGFTCDAIANGPFEYGNESGAASATFMGDASSSVSLNFTVTAPNATGDIIVFPGQGQNACTGTADATVGVLDVAQVADANGNPVNIDIASTNATLFTQIADAFGISLDGSSFTPSSLSTDFSPGLSTPIYVVVTNPDVDPSYYGEYLVKIAAHAPGAGIGVGPGIEFDLILKAESVTDNTPCVVTINAPTSAPQTLGPIAVSVQAYDPSPGSGLASLSASISSIGGAVSNVNIPLTLDFSLPQAAGITVTGTGSYTPTGGAGTAGTTGTSAFTRSSRSGIGTYTIKAQCSDVAGNTNTSSITFAVNYAVAFIQSHTPTSCTATHLQSCQAMFQFDANRSSVTSDGAFMYDQTVTLNLVSSANATSSSCSNSSLAVQSHPYGTASINSHTQISTTPDYQTKFDGSHASVVPFGSYVAQACFLDVDGNPDLQGSSPSTNF
jgi:hypothetical protein